MTRATLAALAGRLPFAGREPGPHALLNPRTLKTELLSGLTVALALVPDEEDQQKVFGGTAAEFYRIDT